MDSHLEQKPQTRKNPTIMTSKKTSRLGLICALSATVLVLTGCVSAGGAGERADGPIVVQGALLEPTDPQAVAEFTSFDELSVDKMAKALVPADIREAGVLIFGVDPTAAPMEFLGSDGSTFVGFNADIARALAKILDLQIAFKSSSFDAMIPGLQAERFDAVIASMGVTEERLEVIDMVGYALGGHALASAPGNPQGIGEASMCGHTVAVAQGSIQSVTRGPEYSLACEDRGEEPIKLVTLPSQQETLLQVASGQVEAAYLDAPIVAWAAKQNPEKIELAAAIPGSIFSMGILDGSELTPALVAAIKHLASLPEYERIGERWGMEYSKLEPDLLDSYEAPPVPPAPLVK